MKKIILIVVGIFLLLIGLLLATPFMFKGRIERVALEKVNQSVEAVVRYDNFSLSLIRSFPDFHASFKGLTITGKSSFTNDTLIYLGKLSATIDLKSVFKGDAIQVKTIRIEQSKINLLVDADKNSNWDIVPKPAAVPGQNTPINKAITSENDPLTFMLQKIEVVGLDFIYNDLPARMYFDALKINGTLSGEMQGMQTRLDAEALSPSITFVYDSVPYLNQVKIGLNTMLDADLDQWLFTFLTDRTKLNGIPVDVEGSIRMPEDSMVFNIDFSVPNLTFAEMVSLIPQEYKSYTEGLGATGDINFVGSIKGIMTGQDYPGIDITMGLKNGIIQYTNLPEKVVIENALLRIDLPQGPIEGMKVDLSQLDGRIANNPFSLSARLENLFGDMQIDAGLSGKIDLEQLPKAIPLKVSGLKGLIASDITVSGKMSDLEQNRFDQFLSKGKLALSGFSLEHESLPGVLNITQATLALNNETMLLSGFNGTIGDSDFSLKGKLENPIKFALLGSELTGKFELASHFFNINQFRTSKKNKATEETASTESNETIPPDNATTPKPLELPKNTNLVFVSKIERLQFDQMDIRNFDGTISLHNQLLTLDGLRMDMLKGSLSLQGSVLADGRANPDADLKLIVRDFDLPQSFNQLEVVRNFLPIAQNGQGSFSTTLSMKSKISNNWKIILEGLTASGNFATKSVKLEKSKAIEQLQSIIQTQKIKDLSVKDFTASFSISNGNLELPPFSTELANQPVVLGGKYNLAGKLDFRVDATIQRDMLAPSIEQMIAYIPGHQKITKIDVGIDLKGDAKKPDVVFDKELIRKQVIEQVKSSSPKEIEDAAKKLLRQLFR